MTLRSPPMPDTLTVVIERIETIKSNLTNFRANGDPNLLGNALENLEEAHDEIEEILDDC